MNTAIDTMVATQSGVKTLEAVVKTNAQIKGSRGVRKCAHITHAHAHAA